jgi:hypothetical protein
MASYTYVQTASGTWHWCKNCSHYPSASGIVKRRSTRPSWDLLEQCKAKQKNGTCTA